MTPRCHVCGSRVGPLEPAITRFGRAHVCADGYACATRANGGPRLTVVKPDPDPEPPPRAA